MAGAYSSSKAAVIGLTKAIGKDVAGTGILVNWIAPAVIRSPMLGQMSDEHVEYMARPHPARPDRRAGGGRLAHLLARERGDELLDGRVLRHLRREGDVLTAVDSPARAAGLNYVGGYWVESAGGETYSKQSPMRPAEVTGVFQSSSEADATAAVAAAHEAFESWAPAADAPRAATSRRRRRCSRRAPSRSRSSMSTEMGKPLREARGEAARAAQILRFSAGEALPPGGRDLRADGDGAARC